MSNSNDIDLRIVHKATVTAFGPDRLGGVNYLHDGTERWCAIVGEIDPGCVSSGELATLLISNSHVIAIMAKGKLYVSNMLDEKALLPEIIAVCSQVRDSAVSRFTAIKPDEG